MLAVLLSDEIEDASFRKYCSSGSLDSNAYRKHHQMLTMNICKPHNEALVSGLIERSIC